MSHHGETSDKSSATFRYTKLKPDIHTKAKQEMGLSCFTKTVGTLKHNKIEIELGSFPIFFYQYRQLHYHDISISLIYLIALFFGFRWNFFLKIGQLLRYIDIVDIPDSPLSWLLLER